jgi:hypothetical protein
VPAFAKARAGPPQLAGSLDADLVITIGGTWDALKGVPYKSIAGGDTAPTIGDGLQAVPNSLFGIRCRTDKALLLRSSGRDNGAAREWLEETRH